MSATPTEITSLRRQLDASETALPDADINAMWDEAEAENPKYVTNRRIIFAVVRLQAWRELMASATKRVDYKQNQSEEKLSQLLANMRVMESAYKKQLDELITSAKLPAVGWGGIRNIPEPKKDKPNG